MGITSDWKHDRYRTHYPDGYELELIADPETHKGWQRAWELNNKKYSQEVAE